MYSQPWSPTPSTTAVAPELRTREALAGHAVEVGLAAGRAVEHGVADDDVFLGDERRRSARRIDDDASAATGPCRRSRWRRLRASSVTPLARNAPKLWPAEPVNFEADGVVGQARPCRSCVAISPRQHRADGAVDVADRGAELDRRAARRCASLASLDQLVVERALEPWSCSLRCSVQSRRGSAAIGLVRGALESRAPLRLPVLDDVRAARACRRGRSSRRSCGSRAAAMISRTSSATKKKKLMTCSGCAGELRAQLRILRGDADRAGVEVALAHHDAAERDQRRRCEKPNSSAPSSAAMTTSRPVRMPAVGLHDDAAAQVVHDQHLLRFGEAELPRACRRA